MLVGGFLLSGRDQVNKVDSSRGSRFLSLPFPMTQSVSRRVCRAILTHCLRPGKDYQVAGQSKPGDRGPEKYIRAASAAPRADVERTEQAKRTAVPPGNIALPVRASDLAPASFQCRTRARTEGCLLSDLAMRWGQHGTS
jgi:hypothetical protein